MPANDRDVVFIRGALHHFANPLKSLIEINRILKKNGRLILLEPCSDFFILQFLRQGLFFLKKKKFLSTHRSFKKAQLEHMLGRANFKIKKLIKIGLLAYPLLGRPDIFPFFSWLPYKKQIARALIKIDEFLISKTAGKLSLIVIIHAAKN